VLLTLDQDTAGPWVTNFGDAAAADLLAGRAFRGHQTQVGHQLPGSLEAAHITNFCHKDDRSRKRVSRSKVR
jgi:hypothetical protein